MNTKQFLKDTEDKFEKLGCEVKATTRSIWLAGVGAAAQADEQGRSLFDDLVAKGRKVQKSRSKDLDHLVEGPRRRAKKVSEWASGTAREAVDGVTRRSTELLQRLGVPTYEDIRTLNRRVAELNKKVEKLGAS